MLDSELLSVNEGSLLDLLNTLDLLDSTGVNNRALLDNSAAGVGKWNGVKKMSVGVQELSVGVQELTIVEGRVGKRLLLGEEDLLVDWAGRSSNQNNSQNDHLVHGEDYWKQA